MDLRGANLFRANLSEVTPWAQFSGANLFRAKNLTRKQIESAVTDENTQLPEYLKAETVTGGAKAKEKESKAQAGGKE